MSRLLIARLPILAMAVLLLLGAHPLPTFAHARYDRSEPAAQGTVDGAPFVLKTWFNQELMSASSIKVLDQAGTQVDLGDGRVDLDDPDRKLMVVSLPALPEGVYTVAWASLSAEDGDWADGTFAFGVGVTPPTANDQLPSAGSSPDAQSLY
jgi:methionine-rich copper-binding protein CopC